PRRSGYVEGVLARVELVLGLEPEVPAGGVDHECGDLPALVRDPLHPEDHRDAVAPRRAGRRLEGPLLVRALERGDLEVLAGETREIRLGEADDRGAPRRGLGDLPLDAREAVVEARGRAGRRERDDHGQARMVRALSPPSPGGSTGG